MTGPHEAHPRRWAILAVMCLSLIMVVLGNSVLNVALPTLVRELSATGTQLQWIVDAYALVFGGLLLTMGAIGDRFGRRGALQTGLVLFGLASLASMFATSADHLIATRAAMGVGAALVMPATLSIIADVFPREERGKAMGIWAAFAGLGGAVGPVVGGWLLEHFSWPSIFVLNLPVVGLAVLGSIVLVPTSRDPGQTRLDLVGGVLSVVALASLLYGIIEGPTKGWTSLEVIASFSVAVAAWPLFLWWERTREHPLLPLGFFRERGFITGNTAIALAFFVMFAFFFSMTQYLQFVRGFTPLQAGVRTLPMAAGMVLAAPQSDRLARRLGTPWTVTLGLSLVFAGLGSLSLLTLDTPYGLLAIAFLGLGLGMGFTMAPSTTLIMDSVPRHKAGVGSAMNDTSREVGGAIGIAVLGSILNTVFRDRMTVPAGLPGPVAAAAQDSIGGALRVASQLDPQLAGPLVASAKDAFMAAMGLAFLVGAGLALAAAVFIRLTMPRRSLVAPAGPVPVGPSGPWSDLHDRVLGLHARLDAIQDD